jgi:hypothetical protein
MKERSDRIMAEWAEGNHQVGFERRDWNSGRRLAWLCVPLLFAGLAALLLLGSWPIATICWIGFVAGVVTMLIRFYNDRFFITRHADFQDRH